MDPRMLRRLIASAASAEVHAFDALDRCCADARREYVRACDESDGHRRLALLAVLADDVPTAVRHTRREVEAEAARRTAWTCYRESYTLLVALVGRTVTCVTRSSDGSLGATG